MKILVACEYSGVVRDVFIRHGHDAVSCDLLPSESDFGPHIQGDVRPHLRREWDMVIAFPPCNYLGQYSWWFGNQVRYGATWWRNFHEGAAFFAECLSANAPMVAVENPPIMHPPARSMFGSPDCKTDFANFGAPVKKRVGLWLKGLPPLMSTIINPRATPLVRHRLSKINPLRNPSIAQQGLNGELDSKERSRFQPGIAEAMAIQWGGYNA